MKRKKVIHQAKLSLKKGDRVKVIAGNSRGTFSEVIAVFPSEQKALVKGVNMVGYFTKPTREEPKRIRKTKELPVHVSNLMLVDPSDDSPTRVGRKRNEEGKLQRYAKKTGNLL